MTLARLLFAWLLVAAWFAAATVALARLPPAALPPLRLLGWRAGEALMLTLIASLWFDSLGHGGWWLLFLLFGGLAVVASQRATALAVCADLLRYVVAGAILAWRLG